jgi:hypothetical protein
MAFQPGQGRPPGSGRKPGSQNKKSVAKVADVLAERDINPVAEILALIPELPYASQKIKAYMDLLSYCEAKPKEIESSPDDLPTDEDLINQLKDVSDSALLTLVTRNDNDEAS